MTPNDTETNIKNDDNQNIKETSIDRSHKHSKDKHTPKKKFSKSLEIPQFHYKANSKKK